MSVDSQIFLSRINLLGYPVDSLDLQDAVSRVDLFLRQGGFHHIVAINANKLWLAEREPRLKNLLRQAELVIPEYAAIWASRSLGKPLKAHVGGIMLLKALLPWLESRRVPTYFLGAKANVVELMRSRLSAAYPRLVITGMHSGYFDCNREKELVEEINRSGAAVLFVAMGSPRQELWIERYRHSLTVRVAMGVGGSFDVLAGVKGDAPEWVRHGGEWLYRLIQDPKNLWRRYLTTSPWFVYRVLRERILSERGYIKPS